MILIMKIYEYALVFMNKTCKQPEVVDLFCT